MVSVALAMVCANAAWPQTRLSVHWEELTAADFRTAIHQAQGTCLLPFGILEKHGPHLPLGTDLQDVRLIFKDDGFTLKKGEDVRAQGTFTLDPAKKPKTMDATLKEGKDAGKTVLAIYELKGDTFKVCRAPTGKDRPDKFAAESGSGVTLSVWKRVNP